MSTANNNNKPCPFKIKYKGYTITQFEGWVYVTDIHRKEVFRVETKRPHTVRELVELFEFNMIILQGGG